MERVSMPDFVKLVALCPMLFLAACGNKGPLYLPDAEPVMQSPQAPATGDAGDSAAVGTEQ